MFLLTFIHYNFGRVPFKDNKLFIFLFVSLLFTYYTCLLVCNYANIWTCPQHREKDRSWTYIYIYINNGFNFNMKVRLWYRLFSEGTMYNGNFEVASLVYIYIYVYVCSKTIFSPVVLKRSRFALMCVYRSVILSNDNTSDIIILCVQ